MTWKTRFTPTLQSGKSVSKNVSSIWNVTFGPGIGKELATWKTNLLFKIYNQRIIQFPERNIVLVCCKIIYSKVASIWRDLALVLLTEFCISQSCTFLQIIYFSSYKMVTIRYLIKSFILFLNQTFCSLFYRGSSLWNQIFPTLPHKIDVNGQHRKIKVLWKCQGLKEQTNEGLGSERGWKNKRSGG
jgi:hypothetical protein